MLTEVSRLPFQEWDRNKSVKCTVLCKNILYPHSNSQIVDKLNSTTAIWGFYVAGPLKICGDQLHCTSVIHSDLIVTDIRLHIAYCAQALANTRNKGNSLTLRRKPADDMII